MRVWNGSNLESSPRSEKTWCGELNVVRYQKKVGEQEKCKLQFVASSSWSQHAEFFDRGLALGGRYLHFQSLISGTWQLLSYNNQPPHKNSPTKVSYISGWGCYMLLWCCCDCHGIFCLVLWETMGMRPKCATGSGQQLLWVAPAFRICCSDSGHPILWFWTSFMYFHVLLCIAESCLRPNFHCQKV